MYTLRRCQYYSTFAPIITESTFFAALIKILDNRGINNLALSFSVISVDTASNGVYLTLENQVSGSSLAFYNTSLNVSINFTSDFWFFITLQKKKGFFLGLIFAMGLADFCALIIQFLYITYISKCSRAYAS